MSGPLAFKSEGVLPKRIFDMIMSFSAKWKMSPQVYLNSIKSQYWEVKLAQGDIEADKYLIRAFSTFVTLVKNNRYYDSPAIDDKQSL